MHTHSTFSSGGKTPLADMVRSAHEKGLKYCGIADDLYTNGQTEVARTVYEEAYFSAARILQKKYENTGLIFLVGCTFYYMENAEQCGQYKKTAERYRPDYIINAVHGEALKTAPVRFACGHYLESVRKSLNAPYPYDIVAHIGTPDNGKLRYRDYASVFDDILRTVIVKNKILEVTAVKHEAGLKLVPDTDVLKRYFELGGRNLSFASDAHAPSRLCEKYEETIAALKRIGFTHFTVPVRGKLEKVPF